MPLSTHSTERFVHLLADNACQGTHGCIVASLHSPAPITVGISSKACDCAPHTARPSTHTHTHTHTEISAQYLARDLNVHGSQDHRHLTIRLPSQKRCNALPSGGPHCCWVGDRSGSWWACTGAPLECGHATPTPHHNSWGRPTTGLAALRHDGQAVGASTGATRYTGQQQLDVRWCGQPCMDRERRGASRPGMLRQCAVPFLRVPCSPHAEQCAPWLTVHQVPWDWWGW